MAVKPLTIRAQQQSKYISTQAFVLLALLLGFWVRIYGVLNYPFVFDEVRIIQNGVRDMFGVGPDQHLGYGLDTIIFGVPLRNGNFLAPLWWWMEFLVRAISPTNETVIYRVIPFILALVGISIFYKIATKIFKSPLPQLLTFILSVSDTHTFITSKAQYVEAILFVTVLLMIYGFISRSYKRGQLLSMLGVVLALGSFLGKAIALVGVYLLTSGVYAIISLSLVSSLERFRKLVFHWTYISLGVIPLLIWWVGAEWFFLNNPVRVHDLGYFGHLWEPVYALTIAYESQRTQIIGKWYWPFLPYSHADVWPSLTSLTGTLISGIVLTLQNWSHKDHRRSKISIYSLLSILILLGSIVSRARDGPRFHVLYLPAVLFIVGFALEWLWTSSPENIKYRLIPAVIIASTGTYTFIMFGWQRWPDQWIWPGLPGTTVLVIAILLAVNYAAAPSIHVRKFSVVGLVLMGVVLSVVRGPLHWGTFAYAEPGPTNPNLHDVEVLYHPVQYYPPDDMQVELDAQFSDGLTLLGYDTELADANLILTLHLRTDEPPNEPYHSFVHLWDPVTEIVALGFDERPLNRQGLPTNEWLEGEHVSQTVALDLSSVPVGTYTLGAGLYNYATNERLAVLDQFGSPVLNNWLPMINEFEIPAVNP